MVRHTNSQTERCHMRPRIFAALAALAMILGGAFIGATPANADFIWNKTAIPKGFPSAPGATTNANARGVLAGPYYHYATGNQSHSAGAADGVAGYMLVSNPYYDSTHDSHTLGEIAIQDTATGNRVELGWTRETAVCGISATNPCLFVYWANAGVGQCYNTSCAGYVDLPGGVNAGDAITGSPISKYFLITHSVNAWYIQYDGANIGYFPDNIFTGGFSSANRTLGFGEVATRPTAYGPSGTSCSDMGTGILPGTAGRATISTMSYHATGGAWTASTLTLSKTTTTGLSIPAGSWDIQPYSGSVRSFYYGGPMWNSAGTAAGTTGSC